jgi:hypothetical protein
MFTNTEGGDATLDGNERTEGDRTMPQIIVTADRGDGRVTLRERINISDFESHTFAQRLVERLGWAVGDAHEAEQEFSQGSDDPDRKAARTPRGNPADVPQATAHRSAHTSPSGYPADLPQTPGHRSTDATPSGITTDAAATAGDLTADPTPGDLRSPSV